MVLGFRGSRVLGVSGFRVCRVYGGCRVERFQGSGHEMVSGYQMQSLLTSMPSFPLKHDQKHSWRVVKIVVTFGYPKYYGTYYTWTAKEGRNFDYPIPRSPYSPSKGTLISLTAYHI